MSDDEKLTQMINRTLSELGIDLATDLDELQADDAAAILKDLFREDDYVQDRNFNVSKV